MPQRTNPHSLYFTMLCNRIAIALLIFVSLHFYPAIANSKLVIYEVRPQDQANQIQDSVSDKQAQTAFDEGIRLYGKKDAQSLRLAILKFEEAAKRFHETSNRQMEANAYTRTGVTYNSLGERQKALNYFNLALPIYIEVVDRKGEAITLNNIGSVYDNLDDKQKALDYYNLALPIRREVDDRSGEATTLNNIGKVYWELGQKRKALDYYKQALSIRQAINDRSGEATTLSSLGAVYSDLGDKQKALDYYNLALPIRREVDDRKGEATTLHNIGAAYSELGDKQKALTYYNQALSIRREVSDRSGEAIALNNIGLVYSDLGDKQKALDYYNLALPIRREVNDRRGEATTLNNIGAAHSELGDKQKALTYYNQALSIRREVSDRSGEAITFNSIGLVYWELGDKQKALDYYNLALPIRREVGDRGGEAATLHNIGVVYSELGDKQKALDYYNLALLIRKEVGDRGGEARTLYNIMVVYADLQQPRVATLFGKQSINVYQSLRADISNLDREIQQSFLNSVQKTYRKLADLLIAQKRFAEAEFVINLLKQYEYFEYVRHTDEEVTKGIKLIAYGKKEALWENRYRQIDDQSVMLGRAFGELDAKPVKYRTAEDNQTLLAVSKDLNVVRQSFEKFIKDAEKEFSKAPSSNEIVTDLKGYQNLQKTLKGLDKGTVALYTLVGEKTYRIVLVTPFAYKEESFDITGKALNDKIFQFREALQNRHSDPVPQAKELYKILIGARMAKYLQEANAETLLWSLDGALRYLPVAALHDGKQYLVERYRNVEITIANRTFLNNSPSPNWRVAGFGVSKAFEGFDALKGVKEELDGIIRNSEDAKDKAGILPGIIKMNDDFDEDAMQMALLNHYQVLHIATHFKFTSGNDADSYLLLGNGKKLALTDINGYDFNSIELLNLSACDTAVGDSGDGSEIEGFGMKAQRKGAKSVMATLWRVVDSSTSSLMQEFYKRRAMRKAKGQLTSKAEALRQAQLALLKGNIGLTNETITGRRNKTGAAKNQDKGNLAAPFTHPYYWAPFILIGNSK